MVRGARGSVNPDGGYAACAAACKPEDTAKTGRYSSLRGTHRSGQFAMPSDPQVSPSRVLDAFAAHVAEPAENDADISGVMLGLSTDLGECVSVMLESMQLSAESRLALAERLCDFACGWTRLCDAFSLSPGDVAEGLLPTEHVHVQLPFKDRSMTAMRMVTACGTVNSLVDARIRSGTIEKSELRVALRATFALWATLCHQCGINWRPVLGLAAGSGKDSRSRRVAVAAR